MRENFEKFKTLAIVLIEWLFSQVLRPFRWVGNKLLALFGKLPYFHGGRGVLGFAVVLFAGALLIWVASGLVTGLDRPIETTLAVEYTAHASVQAEGYILRQESPITSPCAINSLSLDEGQKVSAGEVVAVGYTSQNAQSTQDRIRELEDKLQQLLYAVNLDDSYAQATLDGDIASKIVSFSTAVKKGDLADAAETAPALKGLVLRRFCEEGDLLAIRQEAESLQSEITRLQVELLGGVEYIRVSTSGYFSGQVDGFEALLTPQSATALSVSQIEALTPQSVASNVVGKNIVGDLWYYLCIVDAKTAQSIRLGDRVTVSLAGKTVQNMEMTLCHLSQEEDGRCALLLSCDRYMQNITALRQKRAEVIFATYTGLRVPKAAVRVDADGTVGVYVLEGAHANWKPVTLLYDNGESYVVALDKSSVGNLWPGDEVIVTAEELYDGKVVL